MLDVVKAVPELIKEIYKDAAQPGVQEVGKALGTILGLGNTILWPVRLVNAMADELLRHHMEKYRLRLASISPEKVIPVSPELGVPLLDHFTYVSDEVLSDLYVNLLVSASDADKVDSAHPGFIRVIEQLSPDEAKLLLKFRDKDVVAWFYINARDRGTGEQRQFGNPYGELAASELRFPHNMEVYLANLQGLGIVQFDRSRPWETLSTMEYDRHFKGLIEQTWELFNQEGGDKTLEVDDHFEEAVAVTAYGRMFLKACTSAM